MKTIIQAPLFTWFYNTVHDSEFYEDSIIQDIQGGEYYDIPTEELEKKESYELYEDYFDFDYNEYKKDYSKLYIDYLKEEWYLLNFESKLWISKIDFKNVYSPTYYNYSNDSININITIDTDVFKKYLLNNKNKISKFIKNKNKSYDWFICFLSDNFDEYIKDFDLEEHNQAIITQILGYYINSIKPDFIEDFISEKKSDIIELFYNCNTFNS